MNATAVTSKNLELVVQTIWVQNNYNQGWNVWRPQESSSIGCTMLGWRSRVLPVWREEEKGRAVGKTSLGNGIGFKERRGIWSQCRVSTGRRDVKRKGTEDRR